MRFLVLSFFQLSIGCEPQEQNNNQGNEPVVGLVYADAAESDLQQDVSIKRSPDTNNEETFCVPGERTCSFNDVLVCKMDGSDYAFLKTCQSGCENGDCIEEVERQDPTLYDDLDFWPEEYAIYGTTWDHSPVTYCFENFSSSLDENKVKATFIQAFDIWADYISIEFQFKNSCSTSPQPDIKVRFGVDTSSDYHGGCKYPFGATTLAHAFYPEIESSGDAHFNEVYKWFFDLPGPFNKYDLVSVAAHEIGHSLGLKHSSVTTALMYAKYNGVHRYLDQDDIDGIQSLYQGELPPPCFDNDKDGYGIGDIATCVKHEVDCNDNNVAVYPGAKEICDKKDNDCDGQTDEDQNQWNKNCGICTDTDGDGYGKSGTKTISCLYSGKKDCNDSNSDVYPGAIEFCDNLDNDCDGTTDEDPSFYNNCGKCGPDEIGIGSPCGKCGIIKCKPEGGVMCEEPCPQGQSCCGSGCMPDGGDCCIDKGLGSSYCGSNQVCVGNDKCCDKGYYLCGGMCVTGNGECFMKDNGKYCYCGDGKKYCGNVLHGSWVDACVPNDAQCCAMFNFAACPPGCYCYQPPISMCKAIGCNDPYCLISGEGSYCDAAWAYTDSVISYPTCEP